ncbi:unnamed protein product [Rotaria sp. Silwood1]|nr:unnamed protein product [Rotaria sp. Silwood1]CAF1488124.1 unnamed protein product [Rotaria sp. Silwood1]CAF1588662.1 unnamed protein product [Rotaria sp. Silwood1]CAF1683477.1 unnamed protein product [Rotaria sp. Silwood1]CAF3631665.1 unnamed protein product [Rotaria sp. Silwood1]
MATNLIVDIEDINDYSYFIDNYHYLFEYRCLKSFNPLIKQEKSKQQDRSLPNSILSSSHNSFCLRLRPYNWSNTAVHIKSSIEHVILCPKFTNEFIEDKAKEDKVLIKFANCKRNGRRNAICSATDKLFYNQQMILFITVSHEVQDGYIPP